MHVELQARGDDLHSITHIHDEKTYAEIHKTIEKHECEIEGKAPSPWFH